MANAALATLFEEAPLQAGRALPQRAPSVESFVSLLRAAFSAGTAAAAFLCEASNDGVDDASREMTWRRGGLVCTSADCRVHQVSTARDFSSGGCALDDLEWAQTLGAFAVAPAAPAVIPPCISAGLDNPRTRTCAANSSVCLPHSLSDSLTKSTGESAIHRGNQLDSHPGDDDSLDEDDFVVVSHPQASLAGGIPHFLSMDSLQDDAPDANEPHQSSSPLLGSARSISPDPSWASFDTPFASPTATPEPIGSPTHSEE
jgi:hypothetical protein